MKAGRPGQHGYKNGQMGRQRGGNAALLWPEGQFDQTLLQSVSANHVLFLTTGKRFSWCWSLNLRLGGHRLCSNSDEIGATMSLTDGSNQKPDADLISLAARRPLVSTGITNSFVSSTGNPVTPSQISFDRRSSLQFCAFMVSRWQMGNGAIMRLTI